MFFVIGYCVAFCLLMNKAVELTFRYSTALFWFWNISKTEVEIL